MLWRVAMVVRASVSGTRFSVSDSDASCGYDWSICCWLSPETTLTRHVFFLKSCRRFVKRVDVQKNDGTSHNRVTTPSGTDRKASPRAVARGGHRVANANENFCTVIQGLNSGSTLPQFFHCASRAKSRTRRRPAPM